MKKYASSTATLEREAMGLTELSDKVKLMCIKGFRGRGCQRKIKKRRGST